MLYWGGNDQPMKMRETSRAIDKKLSVNNDQNNGSRDGDGPASMRYTECRLSKLAEATLEGIKKDCVDFVPNYSETTEEPVYLPGHFPHLLCNGTTGIAVGLACELLPHNLREIMDAAIFYETHKTATEDEVLKFITGPDFPTGGIIINANDLPAVYKRGKGKVIVRGEYIVEKTRKGNDRIVFTSIPYKVSKEDLIVDIDKLCEEKTIEGIEEIRDESNKEGVRFVLDLSRGAAAANILPRLFKLTDLEKSYSFNQVALVNKIPKLLSFYELISYYVKHQEVVYRREKEFELNKLNERIHILDGLLKAVEDIDNVIHLIKSSANANAAKENLIEKYSFSDKQAKAILDMKLSKLAHIEHIELESEKQEKQVMADDCLRFLNDAAYASEIIAENFAQLKMAFGDNRRTTVTQIEKEIEKKEVPIEPCVVIITESDNIKRMPISTFKIQKRNTKGAKTQDEITKVVINTNTADNLMVFSSYGKVYRLIVNDIPAGTGVSKGTSIQTIVPMEKTEKCIGALSVDNSAKDNRYVWFVTKNGLIKKTLLSDYAGTRTKTGLIATKVRDGDAIAAAFISIDTNIIIVTKQGNCVKIDGREVTSTSRFATGIKGITLNEEDEVCAAMPVDELADHVLLVTDEGFIKKFKITDFALQSRGRKGCNYNKKGFIVNAAVVNENDNILVMGIKSGFCTAVKEISLSTRTGTGLKIIKDNVIKSISRV